MKINDSALSRQLTQALLPLYWVSGDEPLLVQESLDLIHQRFRKEGFTEKHTLIVDSSFDPAALFDLTQNLSLFSEKKRIEIQLTDKFPESFTGSLIECLKNPDPNLVFIICSNKLTPAQAKTKWYLAFEKVGCHITVWPVELAQLPTWLQNRGKKLGLSFTPEALSALSESCEGNLLAAKQALEKLSLFKHTKPINVDEILAFQADESRYTIFHLTSACLLGEAKKAWHILHSLQAENTEATIILWSLTKELRVLANIHQESRHQSMEALFKRYQVWDKRQPEVRKALLRLDYSSCLELLQQAGQIDKMIKGVIRENAFEALYHFILKVCGARIILDKI